MSDTTKPRRRNDGLRKRCACGRAKWTRCPHPWHANFAHRGVAHRISLHVYARKLPSYVMLKTEAETLFEDWRRSITHPPETAASSMPPPEPSAPLTLGALLTTYSDEFVNLPTRRATARAALQQQVATWRAATVTIDGATLRLADLSADQVTVRHLLVWRQERLAGVVEQMEQAKAKGKRYAERFAKGGGVACNRLLSRLRHLYNWAQDAGLLTSSPFVVNGRRVKAIRQDRTVEGNRTRRLQAGEEEALLKHAGPHLKALIIAALDTGGRVGELLALKWSEVDVARRTLTFLAPTTKTAKTRTVPMSARLAAMLEMRRLAPDGRPLPRTAHVFGTETGEPLGSFKTAWRACCRRAAVAGLHFHDLRREAACLLIEQGGGGIHDAQALLGHTTAAQTSTYLGSSLPRLRELAARRDQARALPSCTNPAHEADLQADAPEAPGEESPATARPC